MDNVTLTRLISGKLSGSRERFLLVPPKVAVVGAIVAPYEIREDLAQAM
jgi:hypothetical protein